MSHESQLESASTPTMSRIARAERITTIVAIGLAVVASIFLYVSLFTDHVVCYGMRADHLLCQPVDALAAARSALALMYPGVLFAAAALGVFWHTRATEPSSRSTAFGLTVSSIVVLIGIIIPALAGAGLYLLPATVVMTVAGVIATVKFFQDYRAGKSAEAAADAGAASEQA